MIKCYAYRHLRAFRGSEFHFGKNSATLTETFLKKFSLASGVLSKFTQLICASFVTDIRLFYEQYLVTHLTALPCCL